MRSFIHLLSLTRSLVHLKLIGSGCLQNGAFDGLKWENLIREKLRSLKQFQFSFLSETNAPQTADDVLSLISSFSSRFWKIKKRWFVRCDFIKSLAQIRLYTKPVCQPNFEYISQSDMISKAMIEEKISLYLS